MARPRGCGPVLAGAAAVVALLLLGACVSLQPSNGGYFTVTNRTAAPVQLLLEDEERQVERDGLWVRVTRVYPRGTIAPGKSQYFQWPFAADRGRWSVVAGADTTRSPWVLPWKKMQWWVEILAHGFQVRSEDR